jgi:damage-control phosphatase, subfamily I
MQTTLDCMPCFVRQALGAVREVTDDVEDAGRMLRDVLLEMSQMSTQQSPVVMAQRIHRLVRGLAGGIDPYRDAKDRCNRIALDLYPKVALMVRQSGNPLEMALRMSIAGNAIDFGPHQHVDRKHVDQAISHASSSELYGDVAGFADAVSRAGSILYLADNAGEIVFDRLLIEQLGADRVTLVVRGAPVLNDAQRSDVEIAGLADIVEVIDNGSDAPGTLLDDCSDEFRRRFYQADLVIAKGQGNYESLNDADREVFLVLQAKCSVIADQLGCPVAALVVERGGCGVETEPDQILRNPTTASPDTSAMPAEVRSS